jgi:hypothetical protein
MLGASPETTKRVNFFDTPLFASPVTPGLKHGGSQNDGRSIPQTGPTHLSTHSTLTDLQQQNTQLRLRLVYIDEVMARRGFNQDAINVEVELKMKMDQLQNALQEERRLRSQLEARVHDLTSQCDRLQGDSDLLKETEQRIERQSQELRELRDAESQLAKLSAEVRTAHRQLEEREQQIVRLTDAVEKIQTTAERRWEEEMLELKKREDAAAERSVEESNGWAAKFELKEVELEIARKEMRDLIQLLQGKEEKEALLLREIGAKDDQLDLARHELSSAKKEIESLETRLRLGAEEMNSRVDGERRRFDEALKASLTQEEVLQVYKRKFNDLILLLKLGQPTTGMLTAQRSPGHLNRSGSPGHSLVDSVAVRMNSTALDSAIEEAFDAMRNRETQTEREKMQWMQKRQHQLLLSMEETYGTLSERVRSVFSRLHALADHVGLRAKWKVQASNRLKSKSLQQEETISKLRSENETLSARFSTAQAEIRDLRKANLAAAERSSTEELLRKTQRLGEECRQQIETAIRDGVEDIRKVFVDTNVLTPDFIDRIRALSIKVSDQVNSLVGVSGTATISPKLRDATISPRSSVSDQGWASPLTPTNGPQAFVLESLKQQLSNITALLENNLRQGGENKERLELILLQWENNIFEELTIFEKRFHEIGIMRTKSVKAKAKAEGGKGDGEKDLLLNSAILRTTSSPHSQDSNPLKGESSQGSLGLGGGTHHSPRFTVSDGETSDDSQPKPPLRLQSRAYRSFRHGRKQ